MMESRPCSAFEPAELYPAFCGRCHFSFRAHELWDTWSDPGTWGTPSAAAVEVSYLHGGIKPTEQERQAVVDAVVAELTD